MCYSFTFVIVKVDSIDGVFNDLSTEFEDCIVSENTFTQRLIIRKVYSVNFYKSHDFNIGQK